MRTDAKFRCRPRFRLGGIGAFFLFRSQTIPLGLVSAVMILSESPRGPVEAKECLGVAMGGSEGEFGR